MKPMFTKKHNDIVIYQLPDIWERTFKTVTVKRYSLKIVTTMVFVSEST